VRALSWPALFAMACSCPRPAPSSLGHFEALGPLRHAVIRGELPEVARQATLLEGGARAPEHDPATLALHGAVGFLVVAQDPVEAGEGVAAVVAACGSCHRARGVEIAPPATPADHELELGHGRAADALWWALIAGEPRAAAPALQALAAAPIPVEGEPGRSIAAGIQRAAGGEGGPLERSDVALAALLGHCAACHQAR
jgi:cytochrome c553